MENSSLALLFSKADRLDFETLEEVNLQDLPGWNKEDFKKTVEAFESSLSFFRQHPEKLPDEGWKRILAVWKEGSSPSEKDLKTFLEKNFKAIKIPSLPQTENLFTGYFEPELKGSRRHQGPYQIPLYKRPAELVLIEDLGVFNPTLKSQRIGGVVSKGTLVPYFTREEIYNGALGGRGLEIAWVDSLEEAYFLSVQGSGVLHLEEGETLRIGYHGTNGHPYTSIGKELVKRREIREKEISMQTIYQWLEKNPAQAKPLFSLNASYVFFKELGNEQAPRGALGLPLTGLRSLAVDPAFIPLGVPLWLSARPCFGSKDPFERLFFAHDTGGAIKGPLRGDVFCGTGKGAGELAGPLQLIGDLFILSPSLEKKGS
jgi:membrane-bound lytic murein transglycosylase A